MNILAHNKNKTYFSKMIFLFLLIFLCVNVSRAEEYYNEKHVKDALEKAYALYETKQSEEALKIFDKIPKNFKTAQTYLIEANIWEDKGDLNKAVSLLNRAIRVDNSYWKAYYNLGCIFMKKKNYEIAIENFKQAIKYNPEFAYAYYNLWCCYYQTEAWGNAKKNYIKATTYKSDEKYFYYNLELTYKKKGKEKEAQKVLEIYNQF